MSDIDSNELRPLDLTVLLVVLDRLRLRAATLAAADLGPTQSDVSQALKRLRDVLGDQVFLRRPFGLEPTAVALTLHAPIAAAVESLRGALGEVSPFVPARAGRAVRLAALDAEQACLVPGVVRHPATDALGLQFSVPPWHAARR